MVNRFKEIKIAKALQIWFYSQPAKIFINDYGYEKHIPYSYTDFARLMKVHYVTARKWVKFGKISNNHLKQLLAKGILIVQDFE